MKHLPKLRLLLALVFCALAGCASFPQHMVAPVAQMPTPPSAYKPKVHVDVKFYFGTAEVYASEQQIAPVIRAAVLNSGLVDPTDYGVGDKTDLTILVTVHDTGNEGMAAVSGFITGFTLGIIPGNATDHFALQLDVQDINGKSLGTAQNQDELSTWIGWVFLPFAGNSPKKMTAETLTNQTKAALVDAYQSGRLTVAAPATAAR